MEVKMETQKPQFEQRPLNEDELIEKKLHLIQCELQKDESDLEVEDLQRQLDAQIPKQFLQDDIDAIKEQLKTGMKDDKELTASDIEYLKIQLEKLNKAKKLDIPSRKLRLRLHSLQYQKKRIDAPEQQISKLKKEIREKKETILVPQKRPIPTGV